MTTPDVEELWYKALFEEDCLHVRKLLEKNPELLKVGWSSDNNRIVEGSPDNHWKPLEKRKWMGRTALHVGARRGDTELVEKVLDLCGVLHQSNPGKISPKETRENKKEGKDGAVSSSEGLASKGDQQTTGEIDEGLPPEDDQQTVGESDRALQKYKAFVYSEPVSKKELKALLLSKDGQYELEALAMAALQGNADIIELLFDAFRECGNPPIYGNRSKSSIQVSNGKDNTQRTELRKVTTKVIAFLRDYEPFMEACEEEYRRHRDFNFLPLDEYLFHFSCTSRFEDVFAQLHKDLLRREFWDSFRRWPVVESTDVDENKVVETLQLFIFVFKRHDGQGRTPFHIALDESTHASFISWWDDTCLTCEDVNERKVLFCPVTAPDGSGKTPAHRAAAAGEAMGISLDFVFEMVGDSRGDFSYYPGATMNESDLGKLSESNGFRSGYHCFTPLHAAILHSNTSFGTAWCDMWCSKKACRWPYRLPVPVDADENHEDSAVDLDVMELVCISGADSKWVRMLLKMEYVQMAEENAAVWNIKVYKHWWPTLHFIATYGNFEILKMFMDNPKCDPFVEDKEKNNALHCVMRDTLYFRKGDVEFKTHLLDYVSCKHLLMKDRRKVKKIYDEKFFADKEGCVNLLLQAGCDICKANEDKDVPYPRGKLSSSPTFLSWWYEKQSKELGGIQNRLSYAANAIVVTATLVATTSFEGPLTPPRGFTEDQQLDYKNGWVAAFYFCNTLSFCLAIAAIILSLVPSLPMPQQATFTELRRTRRMVTLAVSVLFPSFISIFVAFVSSSVAVVTPNITTVGKFLAIISLIIGSIFIAGSFILFSIRFLGFCFPRNTRIKYLNK